MKRLAAIALLALCASPVAGARPDDLVKIPAKKGGWKLEELIRHVAADLDVPLVFDPNWSGLSGQTIEFVEDQYVPRKQLFPWFQSLLSFDRITLVEAPGGSWVLVDLKASRTGNRPIFVVEDELETWRDRHGVFIVSAVTVSCPAETDRIVATLKALVTPDTGRILHVANQPVIVVCDFAPRVAAMVRSARAIEAASKERAEALRRYEELLATSATETAARYFLERIGKLR